jgi:uncharacterized Rmd1/YagE family protein
MITNRLVLKVCRRTKAKKVKSNKHNHSDIIKLEYINKEVLNEVIIYSNGFIVVWSFFKH